MIQTWQSGGSVKARCLQCQSVYEKIEKRLPVRDSDYFNCQVCGHRMDTWNSTTVPSYRLVERKPWPKPEVG
jgi:DNA-directed RNA polymerase subunit RPC12/RpoP